MVIEMKKQVTFLLCALCTTSILVAGCGNPVKKPEKTDDVIDTYELQGSEDKETRDEKETIESSGAQATEESNVSQDADEPDTLQENNEPDASRVTEVSNEDVFAKIAEYEFTYSSGVGAWQASFCPERDGSFLFEFHDSDMGDTGEGYPNGTVYFSDGEGWFVNPVKIEPYAYELTLSKLTYGNLADEEGIWDEMNFISSEMPGLSSTDKFILYTPGKPLSELSDEIKMWLQVSENTSDALESYALVNPVENIAFSSDIRTDSVEMITCNYGAYKESYEYMTQMIETEDMSQTELNRYAKQNYNNVDGYLNQLWHWCKYHMPEEMFEELLANQRNWISEKEAALEEIASSYEGESTYELIYYREAARLTWERCTWLYENYVH